MNIPARLSLLERWWNWREHTKTGWLCYAYGGTMPDGRVRVCGKRRGHLDSHAYEWLSDLQASHEAR